MTHQPTTTDREFKATLAALGTLRRRLSRKEKARFGTIKKSSPRRPEARIAGLLARLQKALER